MQLLSAGIGLAQEDPIRVTAEGRIIDFLDPAKTRPNTDEEWVRQQYARRLHFEYGYPRDRMAMEAPIKIGSATKAIDIAIYRTAEAATLRDQTAISIVVEAKAPDITAGKKQLASYIFASSADGGVWVNDSDAPCYFCRIDKPRGLKPWPNLPRAGLDWDAVGRHTKKMLRPPHDLVETFRRCHNALYKVGVDSEDLAMDMVRIILAKYRDELNPGDVCEFRCTELELQSKKGRKQVAKRVAALFKAVCAADPDVFDANESIRAGDRSIAIVVSEIQDFRFVQDWDSELTYDVIGAAYEVYVGAYLKGERGQYFTPRLVVQLLVRMADPQEGDVILDPSMGSGGFLITAMKHVSRLITGSSRPQEAKTRALRAARENLFGIDKSPKLVKVARTNMILASDGHAGLVHGDTLEPLEALPPRFLTRAGPGRTTLILTNPPFGATSEHRITYEKEPEILRQFELGKIWRKGEGGRLTPSAKFKNDGSPPEYLFLERCLKWLKPGGKLGIVLPRGVLDNDKALPLRTLLLREARLLAVVNCHDDTFKPHTDAKAVIILCQKKTTPGVHDDDYPIFMAISQSIGHDGLGFPIYRTDSQGRRVMEDGHPVIDQDLDDVFAAWEALRKGEAQELHADYYMTSRAQLTADLKLNPVRYLPRYTASRQAVRNLGEMEGWTVAPLGSIAKVFSGPRLTRVPLYADKGITSGPNIRRFFTGNAVTQTRGENVKYIDTNKADAKQLRQMDALELRRGMVLITRSGTTGRVVMSTAYHEGAIGTEDLNRVIIEDETLRAYVYEFLKSPLGQDQLRQGVGGAIVDHVEPRHVRGVLIPVPTDPAQLEAIAKPVLKAIRLRERAYKEAETAQSALEVSLKLGASAFAAEPRGDYNASMPKRSSKLPQDPNARAFAIVGLATGEAATDPADTVSESDPAAVALGRRGGKKGGKARAKALSPERRSEIARKAAASRWNQSSETE